MLDPLPEITDKKIAVIIPAYNEGPMLQQVVSLLVKKPGTTVIVIDDGSAEPVRHRLSHLPVILLRHRTNLGQGAALQTGFIYAQRLRPDIVITFDADGQHDVNDLPAMIGPIIENKADVVLGSRFLFETRPATPFSKKVVLQVARLVNFLFSGMLFSDAHNGFRALNSKALEKITLTENRMAHATEILFEIKKHGLRYQEVPVHVYYTHYSLQKGQSAWGSIQILFDLVLHKLFK
jgi:glycosyltransferase involved in cell wall biosynthesis